MTTQQDHQLYEAIGDELMVGDETFGTSGFSNYNVASTVVDDEDHLFNAALDPFYACSSDLNMFVDRHQTASPTSMLKIELSMNSVSPKRLPSGLMITNLEPALRPDSKNPVLSPHTLDEDMLLPSKPLTPTQTSHPPQLMGHHTPHPQVHHQPTIPAQPLAKSPFSSFIQYTSIRAPRPVTLASSPSPTGSRRRSQSLPPGEVSFHRRMDSGDILTIGQPVALPIKRTGRRAKAPAIANYHPYDNARRNRFTTPPPGGSSKRNEAILSPMLDYAPPVNLAHPSATSSGMPKGIEDLLRPPGFEERTWALRRVFGVLTRGLEKVILDARIEMADWLDGGDAVAM
jgi:hypothetical protein